MPLSSIVKMDVNKNIEKYEGRIPHLYLDTVGNVTVGIGIWCQTKLQWVLSLCIKKVRATNLY